jgi:hypothetical protein
MSKLFHSLSAALVAGYGATFYNFPAFLWGATVSSDLTNSTIYPTVANVNVNTYMVSLAIQSILMQFNWYEVAIVYIPDDTRRQKYSFILIWEFNFKLGFANICLEILKVWSILIRI